MRSVQITDQWVAHYVATLLDEDVFAVQEAEGMEREQAEADQLIESVNRELAAECKRAAFRLAHDRSDGQWARRSRRRGERHAVRSLPTRLSARELAEADGHELGEAA